MSRASQTGNPSRPVVAPGIPKRFAAATMSGDGCLCAPREENDVLWPSAQEKKRRAFPRVWSTAKTPFGADARVTRRIVARRGERRLKASDSHYRECTYDAGACWMSITTRFPPGIRDGCRESRFGGDEAVTQRRNRVRRRKPEQSERCKDLSM